MTISFREAHEPYNIKYMKANGAGTEQDPFVPTQNAQNYGVGIPQSFTKQTSSSVVKQIQKTQANNFRMCPSIVNEHVETSRELQATVTAAQHVGQIFKASQDNINGLTLTLASAEAELFDDFESYADSAALQVEWVSTDDDAELETGIVYEGDKSMRLPADSNLNTEWKRDFPATDFTDYIGTFFMYASRTYSDIKLRVFVEDGSGNTSSAPVVQQETAVWEGLEIDVNALTADGGTPANLANIVAIGFRLVDRRNNSDFYIDEMISIPPPGSIDIELWDMGDTLPETGVTSISDGVQYDEIGDRGINSGAVVATLRLDLVGGKRQYFIRRFAAGVALEIPDNTLLTPDNYYAIVLKHVDVDIAVYGANTAFETNYYQNGYAFTAPNVSTPITKLGEYNDIQFSIFSTQDVYVNTLLKFYNADPGNGATEAVYIEDKNMQIIGIIANETVPQQTLLAEFKDRTFYFPKGGKFEVNLNPDFTDDTTQITILLGYIFEPPVVNG